MFCARCGTQIDDTAAFCQKCGAKIEQGQDADNVSKDISLLSASSPFRAEERPDSSPRGSIDGPVSDLMAWCIVGLECATAFYIGIHVLQNGFLMDNTGYGALQYLVFLIDCALRIFCAKMDSDALRLKGHSAPSIGWAFFFPPVYLYRRGKAVQRSHALLVLISLAALGVSIYIPASSEIHRWEVESTAARIVSDVIKKNFSGDARCLGVELNKRISENNYEALARLDNGRSLKIHIEDLGDSIGVSLAPSLDPFSLLGGLFSNPGSSSNKVVPSSTDKKNADKIISNFRSLRAAIMIELENKDKYKALESLVDTENSVKSLLSGYLDPSDSFNERYFFSFFKFEKGEKSLMIGYDLSKESPGLHQALRDEADLGLDLYDEHSKSWSDRYSGGDFVYMRSFAKIPSDTPSDTSSLTTPQAAGKLLEEKLREIGDLDPSEKVFQDEVEEEVINGEQSWLFVTMIEGPDTVSTTGRYAVSKSGKLYELDVSGLAEFVPLGEAKHRKEKEQNQQGDPKGIAGRLNPQFTRAEVPDATEYACKGTITVKTDGGTLNVREGPSFSFKVVGEIKNGETHPVSEWSWDDTDKSSETKWYYIDGIKISGWVNGDYCTPYLTYEEDMTAY